MRLYCENELGVVLVSSLIITAGINSVERWFQHRLIEYTGEFNVSSPVLTANFPEATALMDSPVRSRRSHRS